MKTSRSIMCLILVLAMCLGGCAVTLESPPDTEELTEAPEELTEAPEELTEAPEELTEAPEELTNIAVYEDWQLELKDASTYTTEDGKTMMRVNAIFTNNSEEPQYALSAFAVKAFQNDVEITDCSDINGNEATLIQETKNGKSIEVGYVFELTGDSEVEVLICTPTAEQETIGKQTYFNGEK